MNLLLVTKEEAEQQFLMHSRTKGSKNGQRLYQYENGQLTPLGKIHYGQMYGWGKGRKDGGAKDDTDAEKEKKRQEKAERKEARRQEREEKERKRDEEAEARAEERRKIYEADQKKMVDDIMSRVNAKQEAARKREEEAKNEQASREAEQKSARTMTDDELSKAITRLQKEKQYSELLNERANREKGPVAAMASKLFQDAAQDLAKKTLTLAVNKLVEKATDKVSNKFKLADFKDVDPYSLPSDKLKAVANAFNDAANLARNRNVVNNGGRDPNQGGGNNDQQNQLNQKNDQSGGHQKQENKSNNQQTQNGEGGGLSKNQRKKMRALANSGKSAEEIAKQFGVSESTVRQYAGEQLKNNTEQERVEAQTQSAPASKLASSVNAVDRRAQNQTYMKAASSNRKLLQKNLDTTKRNVRRAEKFFDSFAKEAKTESDEKAKQERLNQFSNWINGAEWTKEKVKIQAEQTQRDETRRQAKAQAKAIAEEVSRDFERREAEEKARKQARRFGYSW